MKSEEYWKKRQEEKLNSILKKSDVTSDYISKIYHKAYLYTKEQMEGIFDKYKTNYGLSEKEAKQLLSTLINSYDYDEMKKKLQSNLTNDQRKELLKKLDSQAYQYRINKFKDMQNKLDDLMKNVYNIEVEKSTDTYIDSAFHAYYRNVYNLQQGTGVAYNFNTLDSQLVDDMLRSKWSGENYSQRIWNNTTDLANSVKDEMMMGVLTNKTEKEMTDTIMKKFAVGAYQSRRLIQTESAAMSSFADQLAYEDAGIEKEMFIAVHDGRTSKVCQQHDRSIIDISKAQVGVNVPPLHPNCRSHMIPYIEGITDNMKQRQRNPKTGRDEVVDVNENYKQWLKRQQQEHGVDSVDTFMKKAKNLSSDRKQYQNYIKVIGKENMPKTLSKFQDLKYNDSDEWNLLRKYKKSRYMGKLSAFSTFDDYKKYRNIIQTQIVGLTTQDGIKILAQSDHFIERVLGTTVKEGKNKSIKREGVDIKDIIQALSNKTTSTKIGTNGRSSKYSNDRVEVNINPDTGVLINVVRKEI